jgi:hypothetical protein
MRTNDLKKRYPTLWDSVESMVKDDVDMVCRAKKCMIGTLTEADVARIAHNAAFIACSTQWVIDKGRKCKCDKNKSKELKS